MDFGANRSLPKGLKTNGTNAMKIKMQNFNRKSKQLQAKSEQLQKENLEMEQRLASLRQMMQKEREERERLGGNRWKSSRIPQEMQQAIVKSEKKPSKPKTQPKFKILSDKPVETYSKKPSVDTNAVDPNALLCGQCEITKAKLECVECAEFYCPPCFKQFHSKGAMRKHGWQPIDQERPSSSRNKTSNIRSSMQRTPATSSRELLIDEAQADDTNVEREEVEVKAGGSLLEGTYDEEESAASFQEALREWRNQSSNLPAQKNGLWVNPVVDLKTDSKSCDTEVDTGIQAGTTPISDIKFNLNSSLSYADRLMLKKHRKNPESTASYNRARSKEGTKPRLASKKPSSKSGSSSPRVSNRLPKFSNQNGRGQGNLSTQQKSLPNNDNNYPSVLQIQLLPSDDDDSKYGSSDLDASSPIVNYTAEESQTMRTDRRTLSQMGRLAIVELSFSDPENDVGKSKERNCSSSLTSHSSLSLKRAASGIKNPANENVANAHIPHPPNAPSNTYIARQKILMEKNKKSGNGQASAAKSQKPTKGNNRKWQPNNKYVGLNSFFMAGVEKENVENADPRDEQVSPIGNVASNCPTVTVGLVDSWRPESSLSHPEEANANKPAMVSPKGNSKLKKKEKKAQNDVKHVGKRSKQTSPEVAVGKTQNQKVTRPKIVTTDSSLSPQNNTDTPRVSMTDFDFLSALPPAPKGDDVLKLHRASTVTLFALSPQPPDVWNDDSEIEIPSAILTSPGDEKMDTASKDNSVKKRSVLSESDRKEIDEDDAVALDELSKEIKENNAQSINKQHSNDYHWEDDSLSIEDNDEGSGLTSSADGDESDDPDSKGFNS